MRNRGYGDFVYRDFWRTNAYKWRRGRVDKVGDFRKEFNNTDFFSTIQAFKNSVRTEGEYHVVPVYFDFDAQDCETVEEAINKSRKDVVNVIEFFFKVGVRQEHVSIYFSGRKGFHVSIEPEIFGLQPSNHMTYAVKHLALYLKELLDLQTMDDRVYSIPRMWRVGNSIHTKSLLHCVELYFKEVAESSTEDIVNIAKLEREELWEDVEFENIAVIDECKMMLTTFEGEYLKLKTLSDVKPIKLITKSEEYPSCIKDLLSNSIRKIGTRNQALMVIASYLKDNEVPIDSAAKIMSEWSRAIPKGLSSTSGDRKLNASAISVAKSVYSDDKYHFSCSFIRALGTQDNKIACDYDACKITSEDDQQVAVPPDIELEDSVNPEYIGKKVVVKAMVSGKSDKNYFVPSKIIVSCNSEKGGSCAKCPLIAYGGRREIDISPRNDILLSLMKVKSSEYYAIVKKYTGIHEKCGAYKIEYPGFYSVYDINLIPRISLRPEDIAKEGSYITRTAASISVDLQPSREYKLSLYLTRDPRDQSAILQIVDATPLESISSSFKMTPDLYRQLRIFQTDKGKNPLSKLEEIYDDLTYNITKIYNRIDMIMAMDLCYHSVLAFDFDGTFVEKGWVEVLILGDTGQGKSELAKRLIGHYLLGTMVQGESASRTGLSYTFVQSSRSWTIQWGVIPLNDKGLVFIDEFSAVKRDDKNNMSNMRSSGIVEATGVVSSKTYARTRLIYMTNPADGRMISQYNYGVDAIYSIFKMPEDIRRLDLCDVVQKDEVSKDFFAKRIKSTIEHKYTSSLCSNLVLWAWSRNPKDVVFEEEAIEEVCSTVDYLSQNYTTDIPLCIHQDLKHKVARLSAALAARLFSTPDGEKLVIKKEHVEAVRFIMDMIYRKKSFGYYDKSRTIMETKKSASKRKDNVYEYMKTRFPEIEQRIAVCLRMLELKTFNKVHIEDSCGLGKEEFKSFYSYLLMQGMIISGGRFLEKSKDFIEVLRQLIKEEEDSSG